MSWHLRLIAKGQLSKGGSFLKTTALKTNFPTILKASKLETFKLKVLTLKSTVIHQGSHGQQINLAKKLIVQPELSHWRKSRGSVKASLALFLSVRQWRTENSPINCKLGDLLAVNCQNVQHPSFRTYRSPACKCETAQKRSREAVRKWFRIQVEWFSSFWREEQNGSGVGHR